MGGSCSKSRVAPADPTALAFASQHVSIEKTLRADWEDQRRVIKCLLLGTGECGKSTILKQMRILHGRGFDSEEEVEMYRMLVLRNTADSIGALCSAVQTLAIPWDDDAQQRTAERVLAFVEAFLYSPNTAAANFAAEHAALIAAESTLPASGVEPASKLSVVAASPEVETRSKSSSSSISPRKARLLPPLQASAAASSPPASAAQSPSVASPTLPSLSSDLTDASSSSFSSSSSVASSSPPPSASPLPATPPTVVSLATASPASDPSALIPPYIQSAVVALYASTAVQRALLRQNEFHLLDSAPYFLSHAPRILHPSYTPTTADILRSRLPTTGIIESTFRVDKLTFRLYDVGGQRGERKKW